MAPVYLPTGSILVLRDACKQLQGATKEMNDELSGYAQYAALNCSIDTLLTVVIQIARQAKV